MLNHKSQDAGRLRGEEVRRREAETGEMGEGCVLKRGGGNGLNNQKQSESPHGIKGALESGLINE